MLLDDPLVQIRKYRVGQFRRNAIRPTEDLVAACPRKLRLHRLPPAVRIVLRVKVNDRGVRANGLLENRNLLAQQVGVLLLERPRSAQVTADRVRPTTHRSEGRYDSSG